MTIAVVQPKDSQPVAEPKDAVALRMIDAWCDLTSRNRDDIEKMTRNRAERLRLGPLVYAIRRHVGLDISATAALLGIHTGDVLPIMQHARPRIENEALRYECNMVQDLLAAVGLKQVRKKDDVVLVNQMPHGDTKSVALALRKKNRDEHLARGMAHLQTNGMDQVKKIIALFPDMTWELLVRKGRVTKRIAAARYICHAILYHVVQTEKNQELIAKFFGMHVNSVQQALAHVHRAVISGKPAWLRQEIVRVCGVMRITPRTFELTDKRVRVE